MSGESHAADDEKSLEIEETIAKIRDRARTKRSPRESAQPLPATAYRFEDVLFFGSSGKGQDHLGRGWHNAEELFTWTKGLHSFLHFNLPPTESDLILEFKANGYVRPGTAHQEVLLAVNGIPCGHLSIAQEQKFSTLIPGSVMAASGRLAVRFTCPGRASPSHFSSDSDSRTLGIALRSLVIHEGGSFPRTTRKNLDSCP